MNPGAPAVLTSSKNLTCHLPPGFWEDSRGWVCPHWWGGVLRMLAQVPHELCVIQIIHFRENYSCWIMLASLGKRRSLMPHAWRWLASAGVWALLECWLEQDSGLQNGGKNGDMSRADLNATWFKARASSFVPELIANGYPGCALRKL